MDYRPTVELLKPKTGGTNQLLPENVVPPQNAPQPERAEAKSVVQQLDVLLLNAAGKSVFANAFKAVENHGGKLFDLGVLTKDELDHLKKLASNATARLQALDKFTGKELANALMFDEKENDFVWKKGLFGLNSSAKAVKAAIDAQQALSTAIDEFTGRIAANKAVDAKLQNAFTEVQFQCDRRVSEIYSIVLRMYDLVQQDVVDKKNPDPKITAMFNATFKELMPREAIMMHGTSEALETIKQNFAKMMKPLAEKLDEFTANPSRVLSKNEMATLQRNMLDMRNVLRNVRENGLDPAQKDMVDADNNTIRGEEDGQAITNRTEVDSTLLNEMEKLLDSVDKKIAHAKSLSIKRSRQVFVDAVNDSLTPERTPNGAKVAEDLSWRTHASVNTLMTLRREFVNILNGFVSNKYSMKQFDEMIDPCIAKFDTPLLGRLEDILKDFGIETAVATNTAKTATVRGLQLIKAQFKAMMESSGRTLMNDDSGLATSDVRRLMLGDVGLSNVIEARSRGFKLEDVDPATEEQNIVGSRTLGAGAVGQTYLLTTQDGNEMVFKPELDSRIGLDTVALGAGGAYVDAQQTANLNLATQDTAKAFGCSDVVVQYSVGNHDGQFGIFMEKAKGFSGVEFALRAKSGGGGIAPADLHTITDGAKRAKIQGSLAQKLNKLMWLDMITGQGDRHLGNYFVNVEKNQEDDYDVTVKGIDNDASFNSWQIGLRKYSLDKHKAELFETVLKEICSQVHGKGGGDRIQQAHIDRSRH